MAGVIQFPIQKLPFSKKNKEWRKKNVDWADSKSFFNCSPVRSSVMHKKINYDLVNGKLHMDDLKLLLNPDNADAHFVPDEIPHYPIMSSKLRVLQGEEIARVFDFKVVVTNPDAVSDIEEIKKEELLKNMEQLIEDQSMDEQEYENSMQKLADYYQYNWQDIREIRANGILNHYWKEYDMPSIFKDGFMDALICGEEIYQVDIVGGRPTIERLNPMKVSAFRAGTSNHIEDADIIILEDYWSPGRIIDSFYDVLSEKDMKYIESLPANASDASTDANDPRNGWVNRSMIDDAVSGNSFYFSADGLVDGNISSSLMPYDMQGNVRVLRVYWKSRRKILKVKRYDPQTGEETFTLKPETYKLKKELGEEADTYWINEAWEGVKIGTEIYVNMRPRVVQYNRLDNPSMCHFGIIGSIYNIIDSKPYSLVDTMKKYNYLYDIIHYRLVQLLANNWGKILKLDLATVPDDWKIDDWMYFAKVNRIAVSDSFKEGNKGLSTGVLAGGMNNNSSGVIDADFGNGIQQYMNMLEYIKQEMSEVAGISPQREGSTSNRETVGGIERAVVQSSHITEWLFSVHDSLKKRVIEAFLETAKIAMKGSSKQFEYILSDGQRMLIDVDGDEFAENDYGLVVDNSQGTQLLQNQIQTLAQAALQTQTLSFSTIMQLYSSASIMEKRRIVEKNEQRIQELNQQNQQQEMEMTQRQQEMAQQQVQQQLDFQDRINQRDNETKIRVAEINAEAKVTAAESGYADDVPDSSSHEQLALKMRELQAKIKESNDKIALERRRHEDEMKLKREKMENERRMKSLKK